ncbi:MAG: LL-diaminopimelate aminotransferase [bacterium]|nr:LL-diaminopimelate aminotransferase [bacterium]
MNIALANRINGLPQYLFAKIDELKKQAAKKGIDLIDISIGDPDMPTPPHIIEALKEAAANSKNHQYPSYNGLLELRVAIANWYKDRFGVELDPEKEVLPLIGSKEGIGHIPFAFVNPGDIVLVPDPGYPVYQASTTLVGGNSYTVPLREQNNFLPALSEIPQNILSQAKLFFLNYPNNPTSATCSREFFQEVVEFANRHNIIICHDAAYSEIYFDGIKPVSFLQADGAKEVGVEFHSLSKTYNMTGWRIGFVVGNEQVIAGLLKLKTNLDSGIFQAVQYAGIKALTSSQDCVEEMRRIYQSRRDTLVNGLNNIGWEVKKPKATFYVWVNTPNHPTSSEVVTKLIEETGIVTTPGVGFGYYGEGYIRMALTVDEERLKQAIDRIKSIDFKE